MYTLFIEDIQGGRTHTHQFPGGELVVGRSRERCDIVLPADNVSRRHARLYTADNRCYVQDIGSSNGVFVDGVRIRDVREVEPESRIRIGDYILYIATGAAEPGPAQEDFGWLEGGQGAAGQRHAIRERVTLIGRGKDVSLPIVDVSVSRVHARLSIASSGEYLLQDLRSSNGTYVNGQRIEQTVLHGGDRVKLGDLEFVFHEPTDGAAPADATAPGPSAPPAPDPGAPREPARETEGALPPEPQPPIREGAPAPLPQRGAAPPPKVAGTPTWVWVLMAVLTLAAVSAIVVLLVVLNRSSQPEAAPTAPPSEEAPAARPEVQSGVPGAPADSADAAPSPATASPSAASPAELREKVRRLIDWRQWEEASEVLDIVERVEPDAPDIPQARLRIRRERANERYLREGLASSKAGAYRAARNALLEIPADSVYHTEAQSALAAIRAKKSGLLQQAATAEAEDELESALELFRKALEIDPDDDELRARLVDLERRVR